MINLNTNIKSALPATNPQAIGMPAIDSSESKKSSFPDAIKALGKGVSKVDELQQLSNESIKDLLSGSNNDLTSVISSMAKADMSFKLLVGVRNKLIEAYKQTMNMPV